jgi:hypothetical protein
VQQRRRAARVGNDVVQESGPLGRRHPLGRIGAGIAHQLGGAADRRQRRLELVRDMRREGGDVVGALVEPLRHLGKTLRQQRDLARAVMGERAKYGAAAVADFARTRHERVNGPSDRTRDQKAERQRRTEHRQPRKDEFSPLAVHVLEHVAGRARGIDDAGDAVAHDNRHGREHAHAGAAAQRINRRRRLV